MSLDVPKKIEALEAKRATLEQQLAAPGISEAKDHDIRQQIVAIDNQITALIGLLQSQQQQQQQQPPQQHHSSSSFSPKGALRSELHKHIEPKTKSMPKATVPDKSKAVPESETRQQVSVFSDDVVRLELEWPDEKAPQEKTLQDHYVTQLCGAKIFNGLSVKDTCGSALYHTVDGDPRKPDLTVHVAGVDALIGAVGVIELKSLDTKIPSLHSDATRQLLQYLSDLLEMFPQRPFIHGIMTNTEWTMVFRADVEYVDERRRTIDRRVMFYNYYCDTNFENGAWIKWLLSQSLADLGYEPSTVTIDGKKHDLKTRLGSGQYAYAYELNIPRSPSSASTSTDAAAAFETIVIKWFPDEKQADLERRIYERLAEGKVPNTTCLYKTQPTERRAVAITPRCYEFDEVGLYEDEEEAAKEPKNKKVVTKKHFDQLLEAVRNMHKAGVTHGDICGSNIFWVSEEKAVINDWSHAKFWEEEKRSGGEFEKAKSEDWKKLCDTVGKKNRHRNVLAALGTPKLAGQRRQRA